MNPLNVLIRRTTGNFHKENFGKFDERNPRRLDLKKKYISRVKFFIYHNLGHYASQCPERKIKEKEHASVSNANEKENDVKTPLKKLKDFFI